MEETMDEVFVKKYNYQGFAAFMKLFRQFGGLVAIIICTGFTLFMLVVMVLEKTFIPCFFVTAFWFFGIGWLVGLSLYNFYPTIWTNADGITISFLWKRIQIPWDDILEVKTTFPSWTGQIVLARRITRFHYVYGWQWAHSRFPGFLIGRDLNNRTQLLREITIKTGILIE